MESLYERMGSHRRSNWWSWVYPFYSRLWSELCIRYSWKFCAFIDILGFKNKITNFENVVKYYKDYVRCYDLFTSIDEKIFEDINGENKKQEEIEEIIFSDSIILYSTDWLRLIQRVANVMAALLYLQALEISYHQIYILPKLCFL